MPHLLLARPPSVCSSKAAAAASSAPGLHSVKSSATSETATTSGVTSYSTISFSAGQISAGATASASSAARAATASLRRPPPSARSSPTRRRATPGRGRGRVRGRARVPAHDGRVQRRPSRASRQARQRDVGNRDARVREHLTSCAGVITSAWHSSNALPRHRGHVVGVFENPADHEAEPPPRVMRSAATASSCCRCSLPT